MTQRVRASDARVAIVTGGNRGLGLETCRQLARRGYRVVLTSRDLARGAAAAEALRRTDGDVTACRLDVTKPKEIERLREFVLETYGRAHVLVNNAAVYLDEGRSVLETTPEELQVTLDTNLRGPLLLCQGFAPGMRRQRYGRIVNVSSGSGQLSTMTDDAPAYAMSKAALNALTRLVADALAGSNVLVNSVCPGWVRTDMGGRHAPRSVEQGVETIVWLATLPDGGPTGGFFRDRKPIAW
ncbi:MAG: SDR family oxidoreductase [Armatimonadota bacterium]|nr:SDR family oxidoreductase [Armatimonadota bacterium]